MSTAAPREDESLSISTILRVSATCDRFEEAWLAGQTPAAEDYLEPTVGPERRALLMGLLRLELHYRRQRGEQPAADEYRARFPDERGVVTRVWDTTTGEDIDRPGPSRLPIAPGYEVLGKLGQGGMGVVYKALQIGLNRVVALKMILAGSHAGPAALARFRTEGEAVARMQHLNVVQIHEVGEHEGLPFFSLEFCPGGSLADKLVRAPLPHREAAQLVETLARAIHAAHGKGIIHRDLKPSNVLFAEDGTPRIADFGLARKLDEDSQTWSGVILGTPSYMAPEQAEGKNDVSPAADVYGLGAILYACLTGKPPFKGKSSPETLEQVRAGEPVAPSRLRPGLPVELELVCLKCLEKDPARRYESAEALADDLSAWLHDRPMRVRAPGVLRRMVRSIRRRPALRAAALLAALLSSGALAAWAIYDPDRPVNRIESKLARETAQTLIDESGRPAWSNVVAGRKTALLAQSADGTFFVETWSLALVELVRDPQQTSFRLRAEVRHDEVRPPGEVGIYLAHRKYETPPRGSHHFVQLSFNDVGGGPAEHVRLVSTFYREGDKKLGQEHRATGVMWPLKPMGLGNTTWRRLALEVRKSSLRAFWDGALIGNWSIRRIVERNLLAQQSISKMDAEDVLAGLRSDFAPRGGVGLYVKIGSASFRRVAIEPLNESE
jgi:hypothetical protein